jgi:hypothetical protein
MSTHRFAIAMKNAPEDRDPHHRPEVVAEDRRDGVLAYRRQVEDRLGDERPGQDAGQVEPEHRDHRRECRAKAVPVDHPLLGQPLRRAVRM